MTPAAASDIDWSDGSPLAELFHENSKLPPRGGDPAARSGAGPRGSALPPETRGPKVYRTGARITLPSRGRLDVAISDVLSARRSVRRFAPAAVELSDLGQILGWSYGVVPREAAETPSPRTAPSAGALYPIDIYVAAQRVAGLAPGIYHYNPQAHELETVAVRDGLGRLQAASLYPEITGMAGVVLVMVAVFQRTCVKYGERGYRFVLLDCGHVAQNLHLVSTSVGLGSVGIGGFLDDEVNELLELDGVTEAAVHALALGPPAPDFP
jgi:SagB-type dehydrogenase family enzyme